MNEISSQDVKNAKTESFIAEGVNIRVIEREGQKPLFCLTDIASFSEKRESKQSALIRNWIRLHSTLDLVNRISGKDISKEDWRRSSVTFLSGSGAVDIFSRSGRYDSGTFAEIDLALSFSEYISPALRLSIFKYYSRRFGEEIVFSEDFFPEEHFYELDFRTISDEVLIESVTEQDLERIQGIIEMACFGMTGEEWDLSPYWVHNKNILSAGTDSQQKLFYKLESIASYLVAKGESFDEIATAVFFYMKTYTINKLSQDLQREEA